MRKLIGIVILAVLFLMGVSSAWTVSSLSVDPPGSPLATGTPIEISGTIENLGDFPKDHELQLFSDLDKEYWNIYFIYPDEKYYYGGTMAREVHFPVEFFKTNPHDRLTTRAPLLSIQFTLTGTVPDLKRSYSTYHTDTSTRTTIMIDEMVGGSATNKVERTTEIAIPKTTLTTKPTTVPTTIKPVDTSLPPSTPVMTTVSAFSTTLPDKPVTTKSPGFGDIFSIIGILSLVIILKKLK